MAVPTPYKQVISPGTTTFPIDFNIPKRKIPECFIVAPGADDSLEDFCRQPSDSFNFVPLDPDAIESMGTVIFKTVVAEGSLVTIWQTADVGIDIDFTRNDNFNVKRLAIAMAQTNTAPAVSKWTLDQVTLRYARSANRTNLGYNNILPALNFGDFFRRGRVDTPGQDRIISQSTDDFIIEVANAVTIILDRYINLTKYNLESCNVMLGNRGVFSVQIGSINEAGDIVYETLTGVSAAAAVNLTNVNVQNTHDMIESSLGNKEYAVENVNIVNGKIVKDIITGINARSAVDASKDWGNDPNTQYIDPWKQKGASSFAWANSTEALITPDESLAFSSKASSNVSKDWAQSPSPIDNIYGDKGYSSKHWSNQAKIAASAAGGVVDELFYSNPGDAKVHLYDFDLIHYNSMGDPVSAWENITPNSFTAYLDGIMLTTPGAYGPTSIVLHPYTVSVQDKPTIENPSRLRFKNIGMNVGGLPPGSKLQLRRSEAQGDSSTMFADSSNALFINNSRLLSRDMKNKVVLDLMVDSLISLNKIKGSSTYYLAFSDGSFSPFGDTQRCYLYVDSFQAVTVQKIFNAYLGTALTRQTENSGISWSDWKGSGPPMPVHYVSIDLPCTFSDGSPQVDVPITDVIVEEIGVSTNTVLHGKGMRRLSGHFHSSPGKGAVTQILRFGKWFSYIYQVHNGADCFAHIPLTANGVVDWNNGTHVNFVDYFNNSHTRDPSVAFNCVPGGEPPTNRQVVRGFNGPFTLIGVVPFD